MATTPSSSGQFSVLSPAVGDSEAIEPGPIGRSLHRREDARLVTGQGTFVADVPLENPLHISFVRSPLANAAIAGCDLSAALAIPGVHAAFAGPDVAHLGNLSVNRVLDDAPDRVFPVLAAGEASAVGQPIAAVLADTAATAEDACEQIEIDLAAAASPLVIEADASASTPLFSHRWQQGDCNTAFANAAFSVSIGIRHPYVAPSPMETRSVVVAYHPEDATAVVYLSTQTPHRARQELARILDIDAARLQVISPDVGGAFGMKASLYPEEVFAVWAAFHLQRSVRWQASRNEDMSSASQGRGLVTRGTLALDADGRFTALTADVVAPVGCWMTTSCQVPAWNAARILPGPYDISAFDLHTRGVATNTAPVGIYRGAGRPEAAMLMERLVEAAARASGIDAMELRRRNLIPRHRLPLRRATGVVLDSGNYHGALERTLALAGYDDAIADIKQRRQNGEIAGLGACFFVEPCGTGWESAAIRLDPDGNVTVRTGGSTQGHGRETAFAQIAADALGCAVGRVSVTCGDTAQCPPGIGALASRSTAIGGSAVLAAAREVLQRAGGTLTPATTVKASVRYEASGEAWGYGCYLAQVAIDRDTGKLTVERMVCVDDAGTLVNPQLAEGQVIGGIAQGIGEATLERLVYDDTGQLLTGSMMDYGLPRADDMPPLTLEHVQTPSPANLLGAKGIGEAGTIGAPAAICNAAADALESLGVTSIPLPLTAHAIWQAMQEAQTESDDDEI